ncbi:uncharacterized protein LOC134221525 [Armigeres subalbatus]|uniref:uncharacterized protein LOC134221525 n=1 Tax=Armigeres subalbatus TaxID=124917 RepID=UPI002ED14A55
MSSSGGYVGQSGNQVPIIPNTISPFYQIPPSISGVQSNAYAPAVSFTSAHPDLQLGPNAQQLAARHVVPKELPVFGGNPAEWPLFWSSYNTSTQMCGYTEAENLLRLQRSLKGEARKAVNSFLLHPSNVGDIMSTLSTLYGRPDIIINTLLNDVRSTPTPKPEKLDSLVNFGLVVRNLCAHLVSTGQQMHLANPILLQELVDKLPANIKLGWAMHKQSIAVADLRAFANYMNVIISAASSVSSGVTESTKADRQKGKAFVNSVRSESCGRNDQRHPEKVTGRGKSVMDSKSTDPPKVRPCAVCQVHGHKPKECPIFKAKTLGERWKAVQDAHLCKRCLYPHGKWPCKAAGCGTNGCQQNHHKYLHPGNPNVGNGSSENVSNSTTGVVTVHQHMQHRVLFRVIPVSLHAHGKSVHTFAFLDGGSDSTLLEDSIAKKLGVTGAVFPLCMQWTNGVRRTEEESRRVMLEISGNNGNRFMMKDVHTVSSLDLPRQTIDFEELQTKFPYLKGLPIASYDDATPGILIGLDNTKLKTTLKLREGSGSQPVAAKTRLGWLLYGRSGESDLKLVHRVLHACNRSTNEDLHELVKSFFTVEGSGVESNEMVESPSEKRARKILEDTTVRTESGKFQTGLLWRYDLVEFPDSKPMAERRLQCLERRLSKDPTLYDKVREQIDDYLSKGYTHKATERELKDTVQNQTWYLPLGVVVNPKKPEKVRVVWDAAATVKGVSLNSVLLKGPDFLQSLPTVLCRFRQREVAINADIKEMFHQVIIRPEDRQAQRFLWRKNPSEQTEVFVMDVAIFGATYSPSSAQFAKNRNAVELSREFPRAATAVLENHYVDDYLDSVDSVYEAVELAREVKTLHQHAGFELRHWLSNSVDVLKQIGEKPSETPKNFVMGKNVGTERVLGLSWLPHEDIFTFAIQFRENLKRLLDGNTYPTKRELLSLVMSIFDPLGLVANFVIHGKILVQEVWRSGSTWDDKIPELLFASWSRWVRALHSLEQVRIQRCYFPGYGPEALKTLELHVL